MKKTTVLARQDLMAIAFGNIPAITSVVGIKESQIQMATVDCSLGNHAYRMKATALPLKGETIQSLIDKFKCYEFEIKPKGTPFEKGMCYIVKMNEGFNLPPYFKATFSPKSSIGRVDVFVRVLSDGTNSYDKVCAGYKGPIYLEITPLSFGVNLTPNLEMVQFRIKPEKDHFLKNEDLAVLHSKHGLLYSKNGKVLDNQSIDIADDSLYFSVDLDRTIVGFEAKSNPVDFLNLSKKDYYKPHDFWIPIMRSASKELILEPGKFYLLPTKERIKIPPECCAEMLPYDVSSGEFRSHYAGFFDNGFGGKFGTTGVLEVRVRDMPYRITDGQRICRMVFERTTQIPDKLYGDDAGSNYTGSGPAISKNFKDKQLVWEE